MKWIKINESTEDVNKENYFRLYKIVRSANDCIEILRKQIVSYAETGDLDCEVVEQALAKYHKTIRDNPSIRNI